ncbi:hypothetical protein [Beijerinckia indica]|uniref:Uncharacterized protein n=1 Tax=Beijerinckia indica subsp. indica (strain ATCC 9039 / DSM 1715 / NCIMB 8712) TaxID=395963 RepID=B2ICE6_BEII9|nr:hypothetical protein [Beijerinckia indica]ACB96743.1 hypothetical protein Bind_3183 [Beijerinckia indica subsp. indica ATCC 9039]
MPNAPVTAAAAGLPNSRRDFLEKMIQATAGASLAYAAASVVKAHAEPVHDPLLETIRAYEAGAAAFNAIPIGALNFENEDQLIDDTFGRHQDRLFAWKTPARTREGAMAALRLAKKEMEDTSELGYPLLLAALAYFEAEEAEARS